MSALTEQQYEDKNKKVDIKLWGRLIKYMLRYKRLALAVVALMLMVALIDVAYPLMSKYAIDTFISAGNIEGLTTFGIAYAAMVVCQSIGVILFITAAGRMEMRVAYDIRQDGMKRLQELSFSYYDRTAVGYIMARMISDVGRLSEMMAWGLVDTAWAALFVLGSIIAMFVQSWKLALITLCVLPVLAVLSLVFQKKILKHQRRVRHTNSRITGAFNEGIMGAVTTKTLVCEDKNAAEFAELTSTMRRHSMRALVTSAAFLPVVMVLSSIGTALALYYGGNDVLLGVIGFGTLSAFITYSTQLFEPIQQLARIFSEMQSAQASAERVIALIDTKSDIEDSPAVLEVYGDVFEPKKQNWPPITGDIRFENVDFSYKQGETVLRDFNLTVKSGETIALVGETGAGKSTIVNLVCRFYEPTKGRILIDGVDYRERSQLWLQSSLGYVLQSPHLFSGTIRENIAYGRKDATLEQVRAAAQLVQAEDFILKQENGYDTQVGEGGVRLSTGQKQLISFARVLLANPKIFVLDEATSSVDTESEKLIQDAIMHVLQGRTSFIVAHRLSTIRSADRILVIRGGGIQEAGTHDELMNERGYYYELYTNQFREEAQRAVLDGN